MTPQIRSSRLQFMLKLKMGGATEKELYDYAKTNYGVTKTTAEDYVDTVMKRWRSVGGQQ